ncbi:tetratricopeptide repeat-containing sensor histidine kinase [Roseivirga echinicomitans]
MKVHFSPLSRLIFLALALYFTCFSALGQSPIDSLKSVYEEALNKDLDPVEKFISLKNVGRAYENQYNFDSALVYYQAQSALAKSEVKDQEIADSLRFESYMDIGFMSINQQKNEMGFTYLDSAIVLAKKLKLKAKLAAALSNKAILYTNTSQLKEAIELLVEARELADQIEDESDRRFRTQSILINIGRNYLMLEDFNQALTYTKEAVLIQGGNKRNATIGNQNISAIYLELEEPDSALVYAKQALLLAKEIGDKVLVMNLELNQGSAYEKKADFDQAFFHADASLKIAREINAPGGVALALGVKGNALGKLGRFNESIAALKEALALAVQYEDLAYQKNFNESLSEVYARMRDFDNAYKYYTQFDLLNDSIRSTENQQVVNDLMLKYETAQKEQEIAEQELEIETQKAALTARENQILWVVGGSTLLVMLIVIFYNRSKAAEKEKFQKALLTEKEKGFESVLTATEEERKRISKDLHDGIGQQLSALKMALTNVATKIDNPDQRNDLVQITNQFSKSADEVRQVSHQMMPRTLMEDGLVSAIEDLLKSSFQFSDITYEFEYHNIDVRFNERVEISLYRVLQELINNVIKHSQASSVSVQLMKNKNKLLLFVEDNGTGVNNESRKGHGLLNIKSRLDMVRGTVNYSPSPESGTSATISIPL